ncbi:MAG: glycosyltransferase family 39 protein [Candidatus Levybacteria bacterium]|nr:glycosyltransferase family 39 protein [Candidatus Levybacteria bacterium]
MRFFLNQFIASRTAQYVTVGLVFLFFLTRVRFITTFPLFFDEAIYIRWAQYIIADPSWNFISLTDGKQPLLIWLISVSQRLTNDPIIAGRIVSLFAGLGSMLGVYLLTKDIFSKKAGAIAALIYLIVPFYLIHDGLAIMDGLLLTCMIYACYFTYKLSQTAHYRYALAAGISIGLGLLTKSSAVFGLYFLPLGFFLLPKKNKQTIVQYFLLMILAGGIALGIEALMRLSVYFDFIAVKNAVFLHTIEEVRHDPQIILQQNVPLISSWLRSYIGIPLLILSFVSLIFKGKRLHVLFLLMYGLVPLALLTLFGKQLYPRYLVFMTFPFIVLAAHAFVMLVEKYIPTKQHLFAFVIFLLLLLSPHLRTDFFLLTNHMKTPLPEIDQWQFFFGEPSGIGMDTLVAFFREKQSNNLLIMTDKSIGILPDGIAIHFFNENSITVSGTDGITKSNLQTKYREKHPEEIYLVLSWQGIPAGVSAEKVLEIKREGKRNKDWNVYKVDKTSLR